MDHMRISGTEPSSIIYLSIFIESNVFANFICKVDIIMLIKDVQTSDLLITLSFSVRMMVFIPVLHFLQGML